MTKWTPGPWTVVNVGTKKEPMMNVMATRIAGKPPRHCVAICATGDSPQEMENANANLMAAAPDMYAALKMVSGMDLHHEVLAVVDAAMRRARGE